jgi:hypothetical protein
MEGLQLRSLRSLCCPFCNLCTIFGLVVWWTVMMASVVLGILLCVLCHVCEKNCVNDTINGLTTWGGLVGRLGGCSGWSWFGGGGCCQSFQLSSSSGEMNREVLSVGKKTTSSFYAHTSTHLSGLSGLSGMGRGNGKLVLILVMALVCGSPAAATALTTPLPFAHSRSCSHSRSCAGEVKTRSISMEISLGR